MKDILNVKREYILLRAAVVGASALVGFTASVIGCSFGECLAAAIITQVALFTLQSL